MGGAIILVGGTVLVFVKDLHGPPILAGAFMAWAMRKKMNFSLRHRPERPNNGSPAQAPDEKSP